MKYFCLLLIAMISAVSTFTAADPADDSGVFLDPSNTKAPIMESGNQNEDTTIQEPGENATKQNESSESVGASAVESPSDVEGIWILRLNSSLVTMAVRQSGQDLFGTAKAEQPVAWNGALAGTLKGDDIELALAYTADLKVVATKLSGQVSGDSLKGTFVQADSIGEAFKEDFSATRTTSDVSSYQPAKTETTEPEKEPAETLPQQSRFKSVTALASSIDPNIKGIHAPL